MDTARSGEFKGYVDQFTRGLADEFERIRVPTLVLGPSIDGKRLKPAARLRRVLLERCPQYGATVKGEHRALIAAAKKVAKAGHNLCNHEWELANSCELIIILPASPGSFAELGLFALSEIIVRKSLVLFDKTHKMSRSYLRYGPKKAYSDGGAVIVDVDYRDIEAVWRAVAKQISLAKQRIRNRQLLSGKTGNG